MHLVAPSSSTAAAAPVGRQPTHARQPSLPPQQQQLELPWSLLLPDEPEEDAPEGGPDAAPLVPAPSPDALARPAPRAGGEASRHPSSSNPALPSPEDLHPALWRAHQMGRSGGSAWASGYAELDVVLPGGGWPARELTELLLPHAGIGELRLLAPVLAAVQAAQRSLMWFDPPATPCAWSLGALGIAVQQLVVVQSRQNLKSRARGLLPAADVLWALEQALKSGHLGAVLAWLPARLPADALRRLQLAAQLHDGPVFLLRDLQMRTRPSAAPLRLLLGSAGPDLLRLQVLKRRGPPLAQPLVLSLPPVLSPPALQLAWAQRQAQQQTQQQQRAHQQAHQQAHRYAHASAPRPAMAQGPAGPSTDAWAQGAAQPPAGLLPATPPPMPPRNRNSPP